MFVPLGKLIVALVWAFWMMSVDTSLGREHRDKEEQIKKIIKVTDEESPEYFPTYGSTFKRVQENGELNCGTKLDFAGFSEKYWDFFKLLVNEQDNNRWFIFYDTQQALTHENWVPPVFEENSSVEHLPIVLRCTKEISNKSQNVFEGIELIAKYEGVEPTFLEINNGAWKEALLEAVTLLKKLNLAQEKKKKTQLKN